MRFRVSSLCLLATVAACGDDGGSTPGPEPDTTAPTLLSSVPANMSDDAPAGTPLVLVFSEPMTTAAGVVDINPGSLTLNASEGDWAGGQVLTFSPTLDAGESYTVVLRSFTDVAGNALSAEPILFSIPARVDDVAPILIATMPVDGTAVPAGLSSLRLTFSEAMDQSTGSGMLVTGGATLGTPTWSSPNVVDFQISGLQADGTYAVRFENFVDAAGNAADVDTLLVDGTLDFNVPTVDDTTPPVVVATSPIEGAPNVDPAATSAITLSFSEPMDATRAGATLEGGPAGMTTLTGTWNPEQTTITFNVTLVGGATYALTPNGYQDLAGNALDGAAFLADGKLDFTTRVIPDSTPPGVVSTDPAEGATGVSLAVGTLQFVFDEPMTTSMTQIPLLIGMTQTATLTGTWSAGDTTLTTPVSGLLLGRTYRVDLRALTDRAGNALSSTALGDGFLDFSTPPDTISPRVVSVSPAEGAMDVTPGLATIVVTFDEPVSPASLATNLVDGMSSQPLTPVLSADGREVSYDVSGNVLADQNYTVDFTAVRDLSNNALDPSPVLGDGILNFTAPPPPNGFSCSTPLTQVYGQPVGVGTRFTFASSASGRNGAFSCDADGSGDDVVIEYRKTSGLLANGGQLLHVEALGAGAAGLNVEVVGGSCSGPSTQTEHCYWNKNDLDVYLDLPSGTYWIWVSNTNSGMGETFEGASITIEEAPPSLAEGEGCWQPYNTSSTNYTAPANPGDPAIWAIGPTAINAFDMSSISGGAGSISCVDDPSFGDLHGVDAVVEFTPTQMNSVLQITADSTNPTTNINLEVLDRCEPMSATRPSFACSAAAVNHDVVATSTSPIYVWVSTEDTSDAWPGVNVSVREIVPGPGETCATGFAIATPGTVTVNNLSGQRLAAPSCLTNGGPVEWYRYQVTGGQVQITSGTPVEVGVIDASGAPGEGCTPDLTEIGFGRVYPVGTTICIAVPTATGGTDFMLSDVPEMYTGVGSSTSAVSVTPASSWVNNRWMASSPGWIYFGRDTGDVQRFPTSVLTGTSAVTAATVYSTAGQVGRAGLAFRDERVFSLDEGTGASSSRLFRIWDGSSTSFSGTTWDLTPSYPATEDARALTFDGGDFLYATHRVGGFELFSVPASAAQTPTQVGSNSTVENIVGMAADQTFLYLMGVSVTGGVEGLYRLNRADLGAPTTPAVLLARLELDTSAQHAAFLDDPAGPQYLYVKSNDPAAVLVIAEPGEDAPVIRGFLARQGRSSDFAWTFDSTTNSILYYESESSTAGRIIWMR